LTSRDSDVELNSLTAQTSTASNVVRQVSLDAAFNSDDELLLSPPRGTEFRDEFRGMEFVGGMDDVPMLAPEEEVKLISDSGFGADNEDVERDTRSTGEEYLFRFL